MPDGCCPGCGYDLRATPSAVRNAERFPSLRPEHERSRCHHQADRIARLCRQRALNPLLLQSVVGAFVEMHAVEVPEGELASTARNADGDGENETDLAACALATMVGIDLDDG